MREHKILPRVKVFSHLQRLSRAIDFAECSRASPISIYLKSIYEIRFIIGQYGCNALWNKIDWLNAINVIPAWLFSNAGAMINTNVVLASYKLQNTAINVSKKLQPEFQLLKGHTLSLIVIFRNLISIQ